MKPADVLASCRMRIGTQKMQQWPEYPSSRSTFQVRTVQGYNWRHPLAATRTAPGECACRSRATRCRAARLSIYVALTFQQATHIQRCHCLLLGFHLEVGGYLIQHHLPFQRPADRNGENRTHVLLSLGQKLRLLELTSVNDTTANITVNHRNNGKTAIIRSKRNTIVGGHLRNMALDKGRNTQPWDPQGPVPSTITLGPIRSPWCWNKTLWRRSCGDKGLPSPAHA